MSFFFVGKENFNDRKTNRKIRNEIPQFENGIPYKLTPEQKALHRELDCREMINSCLIYGSKFLGTRYSEKYIKELGEKRVLELFDEQKADFDKAVVFHNVYEDSEGISYNSIKWEDEIEI